jgi:hypothetical protein
MSWFPKFDQKQEQGTNLPHRSARGNDHGEYPVSGRDGL